MNRNVSILLVINMVLSGLIVGQLFILMPVIAPDPEHLPDITITPQNISISPGVPTVGEPTNVNATIWNLGNADATNVEVNFYEEDTLIGSENIDLMVNGTWSVNTIDSIGIVGGHSSIAVDSNQGIHISYADQTNDDLKYAYKPNGGSWAIYTVDATGDVGSYTSIALDSSNGVHISYYDSTNNDLKYAYKPNGGSWTIYTVDYVGGGSSLAMDNMDGVHISYFDSTNEDLRYAYKPSGGGWINYTVDSQGNVGAGGPSITVDSGNGVHISYYDATNEDLKYAYKPSGGSWTNYTVDYVGGGSSTAIDNMNGVHISYYDATNKDLKYAYKPNGGSWTNLSVDTSGNVGQGNAIAIDHMNGIHISYRDGSNGDLKYAYKPYGGSWNINFIDFIGDVGVQPSIAIDGSDGIHISYLDMAEKNLKYAYQIIPLGNVQTSISWMPTTAGLRNITVKIDENNEIEELEETNNNATVSITVEPGPLTSIEITPSNVALELGDLQQFTAIGYDAYGNEVSISPTWDVNGGGIINQNGLLTTHYPGTWTVYANQSGISGIASVTVIVNGSSDLDSDGMPDWWEIEYELNPFNGSDTNQDFDLDSLTNLQEFNNFSNPNNNETDGDSLGDGFEVIFSKTNASLWDTNGNGIGDGLEFIQKQGYLGWIGSLPDDWIGMTISWDNYTIYVKTNSSVLEGEFDKEEKKLKIMVSGPEGTQGIMEIDVPKTLCEPEDIEIQLDGELINYSLTQGDDYYYIHIEYNHSTHELSAIFGQTGDIPGQDHDDKGLLEERSFVGMIIAIIIICILLFLITRNRGEKEDIGVQELPPDQLIKLLEKQHAEGDITDKTFNDAKKLLEKYGGE